MTADYKVPSTTDRYTRDVYVKRKMNKETSFRIYQFSFYLKGVGVEAVL